MELLYIISFTGVLVCVCVCVGRGGGGGEGGERTTLFVEGRVQI